MFFCIILIETSPALTPYCGLSPPGRQQFSNRIIPVFERLTRALSTCWILKVGDYKKTLLYKCNSISFMKRVSKYSRTVLWYHRKGLSGYLSFSSFILALLDIKLGFLNYAKNVYYLLFYLLFSVYQHTETLLFLSV